ncbi:MAG: hypothetical protein RLZZ292_27 [Bacteroidota bacterium]
MFAFFVLLGFGFQNLTAQTFVDGKVAATRLQNSLLDLEGKMATHRQNNLEQPYYEEKSRHQYYSGVLLALKQKNIVVEAIQMGELVLPNQDRDAGSTNRVAVNAAKSQYVQELTTLLSL